jgi:hypothetical protein
MTKHKTITGFLVNAAARTIRPVTLPFACSAQMQKMYELIECDTFDVVRLPDENTAWVDDNGLVNDPQHFVFINGGHPDPLAGNVLFLGPADRDGNSLSCTATGEFLMARVYCGTIGQPGWHHISAVEEV